MKKSAILVIGSLSLVFICLLVAGCTESRQTSGTVTPVPASSLVATSSTTAASTAANLPPANVSADLQHIFKNGVTVSGAPGAEVGIVTRSWTWESATGNASVITGEKAEPGMQFFVASVTKSFTSVAVLKLAEEKKLSLDDPISTWLDADLVVKIPNGQNISVRDLLQHTSGIADYDEEGILWQELDRPDIPVSYEVGIGQGINASPLFSPGTDYEYSNVNYLLLTKIVDRASGMPYEEYVNQTIFVPAGLHNTTFHRTSNFDRPHMTASEQINGTIKDFSAISVDFDRGAGDIVSTTSDLNRFHQALREGRLVSNTSLTEMERSSPQAYANDGNVTSGYGLGYGVRHDTGSNSTLAGHSGSYPGSVTFWYFIPETDTYFTLNVNTQENGASVTNDLFYPLAVYLSRNPRE